MKIKLLAESSAQKMDNVFSTQRPSAKTEEEETTHNVCLGKKQLVAQL